MTGKDHGRGVLGPGYGLLKGFEGGELVCGGRDRFWGWWGRGSGWRRDGQGASEVLLGPQRINNPGWGWWPLQAHPEVSPGTRVVGDGSLGLGLALDGRRGGGPRLTQQCLGAGWESLILPGNDGGPCLSASDVHGLRGSLRTAVGVPHSQTSPPQPWRPPLFEWRVLRERWLLAGWLPTEGTQWPQPLPQPSGICHLEDRGPTADLEFRIG